MRRILNLKSGAAFWLLLALAVACDSSIEHDDITKTVDEQEGYRDAKQNADFVVKAIASNYAEIRLAQLARDKSADTGTKEVATIIENDHAELAELLLSYAIRKGISTPLEETDDDKMEISSLAREESAEEFDKKWCSALEERQSDSIIKFERCLDNTEDVELKKLVTYALPALRTHLVMLNQNQASL